MTANTTFDLTANTTFDCNLQIFQNIRTVYFLFPVCFIVVCESALVISTVWRTHALHTNTDIIVASLSVTDILMCLSFISRGMLGLPFPAPTESFRKIINNFILGDSAGAVLCFIVHLDIVAIDRYIHIAHPFYYIRRMTKRRILKVLATIWTLSLLYTVLPIVVYTDDKYHKICIAIYPPVEYFSLLVTAYVISIVTVFICYFKIAFVAFHHKKTSNLRRGQHEDIQVTTVLKQNRRAAMRSIKFFAVVFGVFSLCTLPPVLVSGLSLIDVVPPSACIPTQHLLLIHSLTNCPIYFFMSKEFSKALKMTFVDMKQRCCRFRKSMKN